MEKNTMKYLKTYKLFESKSSLKFTKQPSKKGAKTETYNVIKDGEVIGQIKWSSRMRGYAFLPEKEHDDEIKKFIKDLMNKRKKSKLLESNWYEMKDHIKVLSDMSLELWDENFNVQVSSEVLSRDDKYIVVNIVKRGQNRFYYSEIKDVFLSMISYMESEGHSIKSIEVSENQCYSYSTLTRLQKSSFPFQKVLLMEEELYLRPATQRPRQMVDYPIGQLIIKFKE